MEDLELAFLETHDAGGMPDSIDKAVGVSMKREGVRAMIEEIEGWEPESVTQERYEQDTGETDNE